MLGQPERQLRSTRAPSLSGQKQELQIITKRRSFRLRGKKNGRLPRPFSSDRCRSAIAFLRLARWTETIAGAALRAHYDAGLIGYIDSASAEYAGSNRQDHHHFFHPRIPAMSIGRGIRPSGV